VGSDPSLAKSNRPLGGAERVTADADHVHLRVDVCDGAAFSVHEEEIDQGGAGEEGSGEAAESG